MTAPEIEARLKKAEAAKEMLGRMRTCIRSLNKRADEVFRGSQAERANFQSALDRAEDALQDLWTHTHYLSCRLPTEKLTAGALLEFAGLFLEKGIAQIEPWPSLKCHDTFQKCPLLATFVK